MTGSASALSLLRTLSMPDPRRFPGRGHADVDPALPAGSLVASGGGCHNVHGHGPMGGRPRHIRSRVKVRSRTVITNSTVPVRSGLSHDLIL
eukprot:scaffold420_cov404-Prasinococcus_capsulatus_cf.AAC.21